MLCSNWAFLPANTLSPIYDSSSDSQNNRKLQISEEVGIFQISNQRYNKALNVNKALCWQAELYFIYAFQTPNTVEVLEQNVKKKILGEWNEMVGIQIKSF